MTGINIKLQGPSDEALLEQRSCALGAIMTHLMGLYTCNGASSVSDAEAFDLLQSACYVLEIGNIRDHSASVLDDGDPIDIFHAKCEQLHARLDTIEQLWQKICITMPKINNIALRDTLASIGDFRKRYDIMFTAHLVPCDIDYPLHRPVPEHLQGLDYLEA